MSFDKGVGLRSHFHSQATENHPKTFCCSESQCTPLHPSPRQPPSCPLTFSILPFPEYSVHRIPQDGAFWVWLLLLSITYLKCVSSVCVGCSFLMLSGVLWYEYEQTRVCLSIFLWRTLRLVPISGDDKKSYCKHSHGSFCEIMFSFPLGKHLGMVRVYSTS